MLFSCFKVFVLEILCTLIIDKMVVDVCLPPLECTLFGLWSHWMEEWIARRKYVDLSLVNDHIPFFSPPPSPHQQPSITYLIHPIQTYAKPTQNLNYYRKKSIFCKEITLTLTNNSPFTACLALKEYCLSIKKCVQNSAKIMQILKSRK